MDGWMLALLAVWSGERVMLIHLQGDDCLGLH